jgi:hypothetical protein
MSSLVPEKDRVRVWNDHLRCLHRGGLVVISRGVAALHEQTRAEIITAVAQFDAFTDDNDPYGEHDCATMDLEGLQIIWKIDHFDPTMQFLSDDPADPQKTRRVMTIMLAEEY